MDGPASIKSGIQWHEDFIEHEYGPSLKKSKWEKIIQWSWQWGGLKLKWGFDSNDVHHDEKNYQKVVTSCHGGSNLTSRYPGWQFGNKVSWGYHLIPMIDIIKKK